MIHADSFPSLFQLRPTIALESPAQPLDTRASKPRSSSSVDHDAGTSSIIAGTEVLDRPDSMEVEVEPGPSSTPSTSIPPDDSAPHYGEEDSQSLIFGSTITHGIVMSLDGTSSIVFAFTVSTLVRRRLSFHSYMTWCRTRTSPSRSLGPTASVTAASTSSPPRWGSIPYSCEQRGPSSGYILRSSFPGSTRARSSLKFASQSYCSGLC
jgi:hypothetical protein